MTDACPVCDGHNNPINLYTLAPVEHQRPGLDPEAQFIVTLVDCPLCLHRAGKIDEANAVIAKVKEIGADSLVDDFNTAVAADPETPHDQ